MSLLYYRNNYSFYNRICLVKPDLIFNTLMTVSGFVPEYFLNQLYYAMFFVHENPFFQENKTAVLFFMYIILR